MSKIYFSILLFSITFLSACDFHVPVKTVVNTNSFNVLIISETKNLFARELTKKTNPNARRTLRVEIGKEMHTQKVASYTLGSTVNSYTLNLEVPIKVFNANHTLLLSTTLKARKHVKKIVSSSQADRLQVRSTYIELRQTLIKKLMRKLSKFHAN